MEATQRGMAALSDEGMSWWDAFDLPDSTAEQVAAKMAALREVTNDFYKWGDVENKKMPAIAEVVRAMETLAREVAELKERMSHAERD